MGWRIDVNGDFSSFRLGEATTAFGVNDDEIVVGWYSQQGMQFGFAYKNGKCLKLQYPGASSTTARGIKNSGEVVGVYTLGVSTHGFITSPIKPANFH